MLFMAAPTHVPVAQAKRFRTIDEIYARFARRHPTFGGMFIDGKRLKIWLTDDGASLHSVYAAVKERWKWAKRYVPVALPGRWNWAQLYDWYYPLATEVLAIRGAFSSDIDEGTNRIEFGVVDRARLIDRINTMIANHGAPRAAVKVVKGKPPKIGPGKAPAKRSGLRRQGRH